MDPSDAQQLIFTHVKQIFLIIGGFLMLVIIYGIARILFFKKNNLKLFSEKKTIEDLQKLSPTQFENYISQLFRSMGYTTRAVGGSGDGGIDVEAEKEGIVHYIQCKKFINRKVKVGAVRDFYGAIADKTDKGKGYFITTNVFTLDAEKFAEGKPIELVDRFKLIKYIKIVNSKGKDKIKINICPKCGGVLEKRSGKYGDFMGCSNYPKCKYTKNIVK